VCLASKFKRRYKAENLVLPAMLPVLYRLDIRLVSRWCILQQREARMIGQQHHVVYVFVCFLDTHSCDLDSILDSFIVSKSEVMPC